MRRGHRGSHAAGAALLLALTAVLSACSEGGAHEGEPGAPQVSVTPPASSVDPTAADGQPASSTDSAGSPSSSSGAAAGGTGSGNGAPFPAVTRDDLLDALWEIAALEGDRPEVDLIREVDDDEWMSVHVECMTESGFPPTSNNDQAIRWDVPAAQTDAFALATFTCEAQYPRMMAYQQPYSPEQLTMMYDWMIEETIPCLAAEGYQVTDVASLETFLASYSPQGGFWVPDDGIPGGASVSAMEACPHLPPQEVLYGG